MLKTFRRNDSSLANGDSEKVYEMGLFRLILPDENVEIDVTACFNIDGEMRKGAITYCMQ